MNWDQIESKWAAMTHRVRADWATARPDALSTTPRGESRPDVKTAGLVERNARSLSTRQETSGE